MLTRILVCLSLFCLFLARFAAADLVLSDAERARVESGQPVTMAAMYDFVPFSFVEEGELKGFVPDLVALLEQKTGLKIQLQSGEWSNNLRRLRERQIDAISDISFKPERTAFTLYTTPYFEIPTVVFTRKEFGGYEGLADLSGRKVGVLQNIFYLPELRSHSDIEVSEYDDYETLIRALAYGEVDAAIQNLTSGYHYATRNAYTNLKVVGEFQLDSVGREDLRFGVQPEQPEVRSILQKGLDAITETERKQLIDRWVGGASLGFIRDARTVPLSPEEREYVKRHPVITAHNEAKFEPYNFFENGQPRGHSVELIKLLADRVGLKVEFVSGKSWDEYLHMMRRGELDVMMNIVRSPERETYMQFTRPYIRLAQALYQQQDSPDIRTFDDLKHKRIALPDGFYMYDQLSRVPEIELIATDDSLEALMMVSTGEADATIELMTVADHLRQKYGIPNLKTQSALRIEGGDPLSLHIAVPRDHGVLRDILQKAMDSLSEQEKRELQQEWVGRAKSPASYVHLTGQELGWLESRAALGICVQQEHLPFEQIDENGQQIGALSEMLEVIANNSGLSFRVVPVAGFQSALEALDAGRCDLVSEAPMIAGRPGLTYTQTLFTTPLVIATGLDQVFVSDLSQIGKEVLGVVNGSGVQALLSDRRPGLNLRSYDTLPDALEALHEGEIYGVVESLPVLGRAMSQRVYGDLKISGQVQGGYPVRIAMRSDDGILSQVMNKALVSVTDSQREAIYNRWLQLATVRDKTDYAVITQVTLAAAFVLGVILLWNRKLARLNNQISESNQRLQDTHEELQVKNRMLEELSVTDRLTRLKNRLYIEQMFEREIEKAEQHGEGFAVLLLDIDHFKAVNDRFGHAAGDALLTEFAGLLKTACDREDIIARWGGEEFMVIAPGADAQRARALGERLCRVIGEHRFSEVGGCTTSIGVALWQPGDRQKSLSMRADNALYKAKEGGRNQVCCQF